MHVNPATGEVTVDLAGKTFRLHATLSRVADIQTKLGVSGFKGMSERLGSGAGDVLAILTMLRCLCTSDNAKEIDGLPFGPTFQEAPVIIVQTLSAGLPQRGNAGAVTTTGRKTSRRGRGSDSSPSES